MALEVSRAQIVSSDLGAANPLSVCSTHGRVETCMRRFSLTSAQREIWLDQQLHPELPLYNIGGYLDLKGSVDPDLLARAINLLVQEHDVLRSVLLEASEQDGVPLQASVDWQQVELPLEDFSGHADPSRVASAWMRKQFAAPFRLLGEALFRLCLIKLANDHYYIFEQFHHLLLDGWGTAIFNRAVAGIYTQLAAGLALERNAMSYIDFIEDDGNYIKSKRFERDREYWVNQHRAAPDPVLSPICPARSNGTPFGSGNRVLVLKQDFYERLNRFAKRHDATLFHVFLGALYVYFTRIGQRDDLVLGLLILNRANAKFRQTLGLCVGVNAVSVRFGRSLSEALDRLRCKILVFLRLARALSCSASQPDAPTSALLPRILA